VRRLFTIDVRFGRLGFLIQEFTFALVAAMTLSRRGYDLMYGRDDVVLATLAFLGFKRIVWESHDGAWNICARYIAQRSHALVVVSAGLRDWYVEKGIPNAKIIVIPNAVDPEEFSHPESKEDARRRLGLRADAKIALYIGRLDGWKGTDTLLEASNLLDDIQVTLIGGDLKHVESLRKQYPKAVLLGSRPYSELPNNQAAADILVVPNTGKSEISTRFTSPLKLIAHLWAWRPIIASDLPSIREIVGDDGALLVPADDPKALAEGIKKLFDDSGYREQLAHRAHERAAAYTWAARAQAIGGIIAEKEL
jgi:glycosyltransferase involved in cell wall biosynthesis